MKAKESAEADAQKAAALALREKADQEVITVQQVAEAERQRRVAIVTAEKEAQEAKIAADVEAYQRRMVAEALAQAQKAEADGHAEAARLQAAGASDAVKIKAQADADAAELQSVSITKLAEANREKGLKEAEVMREKISAANGKTRDILLQETVQALIQSAPAIVRELVRPAERIGEIKVLQVGGALGGGNSNGNGAAQTPLLGTALGPVAKTILEASALAPVLKEVMRFADADALKAAVNQVVAQAPAKVVVASPESPAVKVVAPAEARDGRP
jgi:uncharacterized membrane protein YqiK